jgi:hypothetical protein
MRGLLTAILASALVLPSVAIARNAPTMSRQSMQAEHLKWAADAQRWSAEHQTAADQLEVIAKSLREEKSNLGLSDREIAEHGRAITTSRDTKKLDADHIKLRAAHASAARAHLALLEGVKSLERVVSMDEQTNATEDAVR